MKIHDVRGKRSELKRVGDGCRANEQFYVWNLHMPGQSTYKARFSTQAQQRKTGWIVDVASPTTSGEEKLDG